jgi:hypothetical protein
VRVYKVTDASGVGAILQAPGDDIDGHCVVCWLACKQQCAERIGRANHVRTIYICVCVCVRRGGT